MDKCPISIAQLNQRKVTKRFFYWPMHNDANQLSTMALPSHGAIRYNKQQRILNTVGVQTIHDVVTVLASQDSDRSGLAYQALRLLGDAEIPQLHADRLIHRTARRVRKLGWPRFWLE